GDLHTCVCAAQTEHTPCIFEFVYFARPDSIIDDIFVHKARSRMGSKLAERIKRVWPDHDIDVVIPIPDTSRTAALALANALGVEYAEGFIKNRYIGRTFIMPGQQVRKKSVRQKLNAIDSEFKGKRVMLVDDSIVRGTTSQQIVQMAREAGAEKVYFASAAPPVKYPNVYGIDMPSANELVAFNRSVDEVQEIIGCDRLIYQEIGDLIAAVKKEDKSDVTSFDTAVFDGKYVTGDVSSQYLEQLELIRSDSAKQNGSADSDVVISLHNNQ
ncbi:MAG: phosphoribosyltransferase family protein, partial [Sedimenticola sp.]|nr:phosphoribosyltransferase family protein [Sedimenticola sp.]